MNHRPEGNDGNENICDDRQQNDLPTTQVQAKAKKKKEKNNNVAEK